MPRIDCSSWKYTSGFSGVPKFRQSVTATGSAPVQTTLRAASATAIAPPAYGSRKQKRPLQSVASAMPRWVPFKPQHRRVAISGTHDGVCHHLVVILAVDPAL